MAVFNQLFRQACGRVSNPVRDQIHPTHPPLLRHFFSGPDLALRASGPRFPGCHLSGRAVISNTLRLCIGGQDTWKEVFRGGIEIKPFEYHDSYGRFCVMLNDNVRALTRQIEKPYFLAPAVADFDAVATGRAACFAQTHLRGVLHWPRRGCFAAMSRLSFEFLLFPACRLPTSRMAPPGIHARSQVSSVTVSRYASQWPKWTGFPPHGISTANMVNPPSGSRVFLAWRPPSHDCIAYLTGWLRAFTASMFESTCEMSGLIRVSPLTGQIPHQPRSTHCTRNPVWRIIQVDMSGYVVPSNWTPNLEKQAATSQIRNKQLSMEAVVGGVGEGSKQEENNVHKPRRARVVLGGYPAIMIHEAGLGNYFHLVRGEHKANYLFLLRTYGAPGFRSAKFCQPEDKLVPSVPHRLAPGRRGEVYHIWTVRGIQSARLGGGIASTVTAAQPKASWCFETRLMFDWATLKRTPGSSSATQPVQASQNDFKTISTQLNSSVRNCNVTRHHLVMIEIDNDSELQRIDNQPTTGTVSRKSLEQLSGVQNRSTNPAAASG
ncbi:hypothetical protein C8R47DRAFT_1199579 [Mycena vitilis]|nr:hypothetical protein C8R47DRAFT_1199579 [Mycena vitilis]